MGMPVYEIYLLGSHKCLRHGRDMVALDYETKSIVLGWFGGRPFGRSHAGDRDAQWQARAVGVREPVRKRVSVW